MEQNSFREFLHAISSGSYLEQLIQEMDSILKDLDVKEIEFMDRFRKAEETFLTEYSANCRDQNCICRDLTTEFRTLRILYSRVQEGKQRWISLKNRVDEYIGATKNSELTSEPDSTVSSLNINVE